MYDYIQQELEKKQKENKFFGIMEARPEHVTVQEPERTVPTVEEKTQEVLYR